MLELNVKFLRLIAGRLDFGLVQMLAPLYSILAEKYLPRPVVPLHKLTTLIVRLIFQHETGK